MTQSYITNLQSSALSNQNISSALLLATYTNTSRERDMRITVFADQIAGNGSYVVYVKRQRSGAGSAYEMGARTTVAVPSGVTAQGFPSIDLSVNATDVLTVFLIGLAGDTTTPDTIVDFDEIYVGVGTDGNALISADAQDLSGSLSVNTKKINAQSVTLTGTLDLDDLVADVDATETRVVLALPNAAPQAAGGLVTSAAGSLDFDDLAADVDATETRVVLALPNAAPQAAGGLVTSIAGSLDLDEMNTDIEAIQTGVAAIPTNPLLTTDARLNHLDADVTSRLAPTVAARTLDVTATGAAGLDWGNVENQGTTVALSATSIDTVNQIGDVVGDVTGKVLGGGVNTPGGIGAYVQVSQFSTPAMAQFFTDNTDSFGNAVSGSVVKEIADNSGGGGTAPTVQQIDAQLSGTHGAGQWGGGSGTGFYTVILTSTISSLPADGVAIIVANDNLGISIVAQGETDDNGNCTVFLDAGSYYVFQQRAGDTFTPNPYAITVP